MRLFLCLLALCWVSSADYLNCTNEYIRFDQQNGLSFCFKIYTQLYTRDQAASTCAGDGATLANIQTLEANSMVATVNPSLGTIFIGVKCFSNNTCLYDDGSAVTNPGLFFFGGISTPNVGNCVVLDTATGLFSAKWFSVGCESRSAFVCQINVDGPIHKEQWSPVDNLVHCPGCDHLSELPESIRGPFNVTFTAFNTEANCDFVSLYEGSDRATLTLVRKYSGNYTGGFSTVTALPKAMLSFSTDGSITYSGFSATINRLG